MNLLNNNIWNIPLYPATNYHISFPKVVKKIVMLPEVSLVRPLSGIKNDEEFSFDFTQYTRGWFYTATN